MELLEAVKEYYRVTEELMSEEEMSPFSFASAMNDYMKARENLLPFMSEKPSIDVAKEAREWWAKHQDDFVKEIRGAGLDTHSLYDTPKAIAAFFEYMTGERS